MTCEAALAILHKDAGSHFDPRLVAAFAPVAAPLHAELSRLDEGAIQALLEERISRYFFAAFLARE
jgi:HD-GYP domain-containing protein (c-di-GMP phosphodiesterase class II)